MTDNPSDFLERRETLRFAAGDRNVSSVRIRPGHFAVLVNLSAAGALLETSHRLLPGTRVELRMETAAGQVFERGRVVRCTVVQVRAATVFYRGAVAFDRHLPWFVDADGYTVPGVDQRAGLAERADVTRPVA